VDFPGSSASVAAAPLADPGPAPGSSLAALSEGGAMESWFGLAAESSPLAFEDGAASLSEGALPPELGASIAGSRGS